MLLDYHRNTAPRPARVGAGLFTLATLAVGIIAMQLSPRLALAQSTGSESAAPSSADDLFAEPVQQPRTKTTQKVQIINQQPSALDKMEAMQTVSESLLAEEEPVELYSFGDDVLLPSLNAPESPRIPLSNMTTAPDSMFTQGLSQPKDTRKPVRIRGRQSSSQQAEAEAENYFDDMESNPFKQHVETDYGHTLQMLAQVTPEAEFNHRSHSESGLEKRLDALEGLVHRLLETNARQKASSGMQRREGDVYAEHQNQASTADAVPNPYAGLLNEQSIRQNTTRYHRQTTRSARQESLDGLAKLREEKAKLEAERQRLQEKLTTLEKQVQTLTIKMLQEMQEIESGNQTRNMP